MNTGSGRSDSITGTEDFGPFLTTVIAVCLFLFGFPAWLLGFVARRTLQRFLSFSWRLLIWLALLGLSAFALSLQYQSGTHDQLDFLRWPWGTLWADTWPVWGRTLVGMPIVALFQELVANTHGSRTVRQFREIERRRKLRIARALQRALVETPFTNPSCSSPIDVIPSPQYRQSSEEAGRQAASLAQWCCWEWEKEEALHRQREEQTWAVWRGRYPGLLDET